MVVKKKLQKEISIEFNDPYLQKRFEFKIVPIENLEIISYQRKPSNYHIKHLSSSIERIGFVVPLIVVQNKENNYLYIIIDGQHRYLAAKELGIRELPVIVVPEELARLMMNLNIEKELNIREKSFVALSVYRQYLSHQPEILESDPEIIDSLDQIYYVTLGIAYEQQQKLTGNSFESILKKCDYFLDEKLVDAFEIRKLRASKLVMANNLIKEISQKLKESGKWHPYVHQQIISWANPYKRKRLLTDFDELWMDIIDNLKKALEKPELILGEKINEFFV
ncbi:MAG: chromosome partitioning protein ParB [Candidatus Parcubacteria bacterium]|nr:MAG: chromosome partitioning protein ParB [Candidatus Parcubacteria bacterium]